MTINNIDLNDFLILADNSATCNIAKHELVEHFQKFLDYGRKTPATQGHKIVIGKVPCEFFSEDKISLLKDDDSFSVFHRNGNIYIVGKTDKGTLFGVYHFLNLIGIEWLTPEVTFFYKRKDENIEIADIDFNFTSKLRLDYSYIAFDEKYRTRQRLEFTVGEINNRKAYGDLSGVEFAFDWGLFGHTFEKLVPYEEYFESHPEYFSFAPGRYGENHRYQICLTNNEVFEIVLQKVLKYLRAHSSCKILSISQNDAYGDFENNYCLCDNCKRVFEREESYSGVIIDFVNRIARVVKKEFPDVIIHTFAYHFSKKPPKYIKPEDNVMVQYCINSPFNRILTDETEEKCRIEKAQIDKWFEISKKVFIWNYWCNFSFYFVPLANFKALYYDTVYLLKKGAYGIFQQGNGDVFPFEFYELRAYLVAKLFQNPFMSYEEYLGYIDLFLIGFYGKNSAPFIRQYLDFLCEYVAKAETLQGEKRENFKMLANDDFIIRGEGYWNKAIQNADSDSYKNRIKNSKVSFDFCRLMNLYNKVNSGEIGMDRYEAEHKRLVKYAYSYYGKFIYAEGIGNQITDISKLDYSLSPFKVNNITKKIILIKDEWSEINYSDDNTDPEIKDFSFSFKVKKNHNKLKLRMSVKDPAPYFCTNNMDDWEQDSVELFFSETNHKTKSIDKGDFKFRINAEGVYTAFGEESRFTVLSFEKNGEGYCFDLEVDILMNKAIGFEVIAHNFCQNGYVNTVYWNSIKRADMSLYPYTLGEIIF